MNIVSCSLVCSHNVGPEDAAFVNLDHSFLILVKDWGHYHENYFIVSFSFRIFCFTKSVVTTAELSVIIRRRLRCKLPFGSSFLLSDMSSYLTALSTYLLITIITFNHSVDLNSLTTSFSLLFYCYNQVTNTSPVLSSCIYSNCYVFIDWNLIQNQRRF